ncbi:MAG: ribonuclease R [Candidatus Sumerlaeia bacterium]
MQITPEQLMDFFKSHPDRSYTVREVMHDLDVAPSFRQMCLRMLQKLVHDGQLIQRGRNRFCLAAKRRNAEGLIHVSKKGAGFLIGQARNGEDLYIHSSNLGEALDGDTVEAEVFAGKRGKEEGRVVRVLEHKHENLVGQFKRTGRGGTVTPRNVKVGRWVVVRRAPDEDELPDGAWVKVRIVEWSRSLEEPLQGEIEEVLGMPGDKGISVLVLLKDMGVEQEFPPEVLEEAKHYRKPVTKAEETRRLNLREKTIITIDPATAKDFDDALSLEILENGNWWLGVHIADVSHYVKEESAMDEEAFTRGTSIYPVDRVVPMLPERLSNDLCSLRPHEDRYAMSVFMEIDKRGQVLRSEMAESIICSTHRLNYGEVQEYFDKPKERESFFFHDAGEMLLELLKLSRTLTQMRMDRGALDLDLPETEVVCNEAGDSVGLKRHDRFDSNRLVEECMLIANETVAEYMRKKKLPLLYRIHDYPDPSALERIGPILSEFGVKIPKKIKPDPQVYQEIIDSLRHADGGHIGQQQLLGSLMKAEYSPLNKIHFGLASKCYCHFTSPIRRYPDLITHRVLKRHLQDKADEAWLEEVGESLSMAANQSNLTADNAESIEREAVDIKSMEFMVDQVGGIFDGWISGIARRGFFVELVEYPVEGFVLSRNLSGDTFAPNKAHTRLEGRRTRKSWRLGQRVRVQITNVHPLEGDMELMLLEKGGTGGDGSRGKSKSKKKRRR